MFLFYAEMYNGNKDYYLLSFKARAPGFNVLNSKCNTIFFYRFLVSNIFYNYKTKKSSL